MTTASRVTERTSLRIMRNIIAGSTWSALFALRQAGRLSKEETVTVSPISRPLIVLASAVLAVSLHADSVSRSEGEQQARRRQGGGVFSGSRADTPPASSRSSTANLTGWTRHHLLAGREREIAGETHAERDEAEHFLIWRGEKVRDFELKVEFRLNGTNSGIQYRSTELPNVGKWVLKGYQADIDFGGLYTGNVHDERGRGPGDGHAVLSRRGQVTRIVEGPKYKVVGTIGDPTLLRGVLNVNNWNRYHIIARGPVLMQFINEQLMAGALDEAPAKSSAEGVMGSSMHTGRRSRFSTATCVSQAVTAGPEERVKNPFAWFRL